MGLAVSVTVFKVLFMVYMINIYFNVQTVLCSSEYGHHRRIVKRSDAKNCTMSEINDISSFLDALGRKEPMDLVLILDRSDSIYVYDFYQKLKKMAEDLIRHCVRLDQNYIRLSVLTVAQNVTIIFDGISSDPVTKCQVLGKFWDEVKFYKESFYSKMMSAMKTASEILSSGRGKRNPGLKQAVLVFSDGEWDTSEAPIERDALLKDCVNIFAVQIGSYVSSKKNQEWVHYLVGDDGMQRTADGERIWKEEIKKYNIIAQDPPDFIIAENKECSSECSSCFCDNISGYYSCRCINGFTSNRCSDTCKPSLCPGEFCVTSQEAFFCSSGSLHTSCDDQCGQNGYCQKMNQGAFACRCDWGFKGHHCEIDEDECAFNPCEEGHTCKQSGNFFACERNKTPEQKYNILVIVVSVLMVVLIIIALTVLVVIITKRRGRQNHKHSHRNMDQRPSIPTPLDVTLGNTDVGGTDNETFDELEKRPSVRTRPRRQNRPDSMAVPSPPSRRPDLPPKVEDCADYENLVPCQGMNEWQEYITEVLFTSKKIVDLCVINNNRRLWIASKKKFVLSQGEIADLQNILKSKNQDALFVFRDQTYKVIKKDNAMLQAKLILPTTDEYINPTITNLYVGKSKFYLVVGIANVGDMRHCTTEMDWIRSQLAKQGY